MSNFITGGQPKKKKEAINKIRKLKTGIKFKLPKAPPLI